MGRGSACVYSRNGVSYGQTKIIMAMHADWNFYCCFHHIFDKLANILWSGIAYGIRNIQSVSTCTATALKISLTNFLSDLVASSAENSTCIPCFFA